MNQNNRPNIVWSIFKISRNEKGKYAASSRVTKKWLARQREKTNQLSIVIIPDLFAEIIYSCKLKQKEKFILNLKQELNTDNIFFESELTNKYWSREQYLQEYKGELLRDWDNETFEKEIEKRKVMYNPKGYEIPDKELLKMSKQALALFKVEDILIKKVIQYL